MQNSIDSIALVICTRNRPSLVEGLLENLDLLTAKPGKILIVDSSEDDLTLNLISETNLGVGKRILYVKSTPGLPHQRNEGVRRILNSYEFDEVKIISFTDDDCRLSPNYFVHLSKLMEDEIKFAAVTGVSIPLKHRNASFLRRLFLLDSRTDGSVLKSGCTTPVQCTNGFCEVDWIPGGSMNIKRIVFESIEFDDKLRMYGEDLKMSLLVKEVGPLLAHAEMKYQHLEASLGKDNLRDVISFTDGIRWQLSFEFPDKIQRRFVLWSIFGSLTANLIAILNRGEQNQECRAILLGHFNFLQRLVTGQPYVQKID